MFYTTAGEILYNSPMTQNETAALVGGYLGRLQTAPNEQVRVNHFQTLLLRLFPAGTPHHEGVQRIISGAQAGMISARKRGFADFADGELIIEFKKALDRRQLAGAKAQLWRYYETRVARAEAQQGAAAEHRLVAADGAEWIVFGVNRLALAEGEKISASRGLLQIERFSAAPDNAAEFRLFLERTLFLAPRVLEARCILADFGATSATLARAMKALQDALPSPDRDGQAATAYAVWRDYLSRAYGRDRGVLGLFHAHTYLASLAKILAFMFLKKGVPPARKELPDILTGGAFERMRVANFAAADFFAWCAVEKFDLVAPALENIAAVLARYDFSAPPRRDILQEIYQQVVDHETRHDLGEYYTPDWLCERIVGALKIAPGERVLDPACGSGSFLRAVAERKISQNPDISAAALTDEIAGFDIHPVAVQTAKTTLLLALGDKARSRKKMLRLNVHLANTLQIPTEKMGVFGDELRLPFPVFPREKTADAESRRTVNIPEDFRRAYGRAIDCCDRVSGDENVRLGNGRNGGNGRAFRSAVSRIMPGVSLSEESLNSMREIARLMRDAKRHGMNGIWNYVLTNLAQPFVRRNAFDFVVGNPPWLTFKEIKNRDYQGEIARLAASHKMSPPPQNKTQMEIASVFAAHSAGAYLKDGGQMGLVMPASILDKGQHEPLRAGAPEKLAIRSIWDCRKVSPLFNIGCVVMFARRQNGGSGALDGAYEKGFPGLRLSGKLWLRNASSDVAALAVGEKKVKWRRWRTGFLSKNLPASVFSHVEIKPVRSGSGHYRRLFRNGATIFPNLFYYVQAEGLDATPIDWEEVDPPVHIRSDEDAVRMAKRPWSGLPHLTGEADPRLMFRVAIGRVLYPFQVHNPMLAHLPVDFASGGGFEMLSDERIRMEFPDSAAWFAQVGELWDYHRTERSEGKEISHARNLNHQNKLTAQGGNAWMVVYNAAGSRCCAAVVDARAYRNRFIAENQTYWLASDSADECHYLAAILNAKPPMDILRPFVERHIHTRILELPIPEFKPSRQRDMKLAALAKRCAKLSRKFLLDKFGEEGRAGPREHGRIRTQIREEVLKDHLAEIDRIVERILRP